MTKPKAKAKGKKPRTQVGKPSRDRFVDEFMIDRNATQAAIRAGYSAKTAGAAGHRLLKTVEICEEINKRSAEQSQRLRITADRVMQEYEALALLDPLELFTPEGNLKSIHEIPEAARRAIAGLDLINLKTITTEDVKVEVVLKKVKLVDKKGALDSIAKILGMMRDKVDVNLRVSAEEQEAAIDAELADLA